MRQRTPASVGLYLGLGLGACTPEPQVVVLATRELGPIPVTEPEAAAVATRERGYSVFAFARSIWLFGATTLTTPDEQGSRARASGWSHTPDLGAKDGIDLFETPIDEHDGPAELFAPTAEELAFNQAQADDGPRLVIEPMAAVRDDARDRILLFYSKRRRAGSGEYTRIGSSLAVWTELEVGPIRPVLDAGAEEPTLLFTAPDPPFGQAAAVVGEQLYAYGCAEQLYRPCALARVELAAVFERDAWRFWTGREWSPDPAEAVAVLEANTVLSVHRNDHVDRWLAFYAAPEGDALLLRWAPAPEGPWSPATAVLERAEPISDALAHGEYRRAGGQLEYLSYRVAGELRLVELELAPGE